MSKSYFFSTLLLLVAGFLTVAVKADQFALPGTHQSVIGQVRTVVSQPGDDIGRLGRRYDVGYFELVEANPTLNADAILPTGTTVVVPSQFLIPPVMRKGLVINLAELRLYYFTPDGKSVITHPIGIGRQGWNTPVGLTTVTTKVVNPVWTPTPHIIAARAAEGIELPKNMPPGVDNPLGGFKMLLGIPTYLIHGTNDPSGVGRRSSSGCIRMLPEDIESLFQLVTVKTPVQIINDPFKAVWHGDELYLEAHVPLQEQLVNSGDDAMPIVNKVITAALQQRPGDVDWEKVRTVVSQHSGIPTVIGTATGAWRSAIPTAANTATISKKKHANKEKL